MSKILEAAKFAKEAHDGQYRKYNNLPYIIHPMRVAGNVMLHESATDVIVAAAWLHDVLEDCKVTPRKLFDLFGMEVEKLVIELTNPSKDSKLPRSVRKEMDRNHLATVSHPAKIIKLYDRLDNLKEIYQAPEDFVVLYCKESCKLLEVIGDADYDIQEQIMTEIESLMK